MNPVPPLPRWLEHLFPDGMRRSMIDAGGPRIHVMEWGPESARPVLLLHGNPSWGFLYRKVVRELQSDGGEPLRLIAPDLVGLGCSDKPRDASVHTLEAHGQWLGRLIDALDLDRLVFVGQDWGGPMGLHALASRLDRVAGMVILNTVVGPPREGFRPTSFHRFARTAAADVAFRFLGFPQNAMLLAQGDKTSILGRAALGYWWPLRHLRDRTAPLALARMVPDTMDHPSIAALAVSREAFTRFRGPVAIVWGDRDPVLGGVRRHIEGLVPRAKVTRTKAGHFLQEEVPREIAAAVRDVLARA
jgi:haloalkane dehalogenase